MTTSKKELSPKLKNTIILSVMGVIIVTLTFSIVMININNTKRIEQQDAEMENFRNDISEYIYSGGLDGKKTQTLKENLINSIARSNPVSDDTISKKLWLSLIYMNEEQYEDAIKLLTNTIELDGISNSNLIDVMIRLGDVYSKSNQKDLARETYNKILDLPIHEPEYESWEGIKSSIELKISKLDQE